MTIIRVEKEELELRVSQITTHMVNEEVEERLAPIRSVIRIHAFCMSALLVGSLILWLGFDSKNLFDEMVFLSFMFFVWIVPIWSKTQYVPRWMEATWIEIDDRDKGEQ